jgi:hypothetical protein
MTTETLDWAPSSCALPTVERPLREKEFANLFAFSLRRASRTSPTNAELTLAADSLPQARDLAERETSCCSFFSFEVREVGAEAVMSITVPDAHVAVLDALLDSALRARDSESAGA